MLTPRGLLLLGPASDEDLRAELAFGAGALRDRLDVGTGGDGTNPIWLNFYSKRCLPFCVFFFCETSCGATAQAAENTCAAQRPRQRRTEASQGGRYPSMCQ